MQSQQGFQPRKTTKDYYREARKFSKKHSTAFDADCIVYRGSRKRQRLPGLGLHCATVVLQDNIIFAENWDRVKDAKDAKKRKGRGEGRGRMENGAW